MKIKNISKKAMHIPSKLILGKKEFILEPGQIAYLDDSRSKDNQIIIWERKKFIEVSDEEMPRGLELNHAYSVHSKPANDHKSPNVKISIEVEEEEIDTEGMDGDLFGDDEPEEVLDENSSDDNEPAPKKNKGGRPKGAKNKKKKKKRGAKNKNTSPNSSDSTT